MKNKVILTSDWHILEKDPICRTDNYLESLLKKLLFIADIQEKHDCQIIHAGDLFDTWKSSHYLVSWAYHYLPKNILTILGQHEIPGHNIALYKKTNLYVLDVTSKLKVVTTPSFHEAGTKVAMCFPYGKFSLSEVARMSKASNKKFIIVLHGMFQQPGNENPYIESIMSVHDLLDQLPESCMGVLAGDNHKSFLVKKRKKWFLSPGSLMRLAADQIDHEPKIFLWDSNSNDIETIAVPFEKNAVSKDHLKEAKERDAKIEAFVNRVKKDYEISLSYYENLLRFFKRNNTRRGVQETILGALDDIQFHKEER